MLFTKCKKTIGNEKNEAKSFSTFAEIFYMEKENTFENLEMQMEHLESSEMVRVFLLIS